MTVHECVRYTKTTRDIHRLDKRSFEFVGQGVCGSGINGNLKTCYIQIVLGIWNAPNETEIQQNLSMGDYSLNGYGELEYLFLCSVT